MQGYPTANLLRRPARVRWFENLHLVGGLGPLSPLPGLGREIRPAEQIA